MVTVQPQTKQHSPGSRWSESTLVFSSAAGLVWLHQDRVAEFPFRLQSATAFLCQSPAAQFASALRMPCSSVSAGTVPLKSSERFNRAWPLFPFDHGLHTPDSQYCLSGQTLVPHIPNVGTQVVGSPEGISIPVGYEHSIGVYALMDPKSVDAIHVPFPLVHAHAPAVLDWPIKLVERVASTYIQPALPLSAGL